MRTHEDNPQDWYYLAAERVRSADAVFETLGGTYSAMELLQEAAERYLKGYLIAHGWDLLKTHDLRRLVAEAQRFDAQFEQFDVLATRLTEQYFLVHYPGGDLTGIGNEYVTLRKQLGDLIALIAPQSRESPQS